MSNPVSLKDLASIYEETVNNLQQRIKALEDVNDKRRHAEYAVADARKAAIVAAKNLQAATLKAVEGDRESVRALTALTPVDASY